MAHDTKCSLSPFVTAKWVPLPDPCGCGHWLLWRYSSWELTLHMEVSCITREHTRSNSSPAWPGCQGRAAQLGTNSRLGCCAHKARAELAKQPTHDYCDTLASTSMESDLGSPSEVDGLQPHLDNFAHKYHLNISCCYYYYINNYWFWRYSPSLKQ